MPHVLQIRAQPDMRAESGRLEEIAIKQTKEVVDLKLEEKVSLPLAKNDAQPDMEAVITPKTVLTRRMTSMKERSHADNTDPVSDIYPMPKWPVNHVSAAFDAVAVKKSLVLSPAEIYAECAHHGEHPVATFPLCRFCSCLLSVSTFPWERVYKLASRRI